MHSTLRSILAVIGGFIAMSVTIGILTVVLISTMHPQRDHLTSGYLVVSVLFRMLSAAVGGFVTGLIAPARPLEHGYVLACVMLVMGALAYPHFKSSQPDWYTLMLLLGAPAFAVAGAAICRISAKRAAV